MTVSRDLPRAEKLYQKTDPCSDCSIRGRKAVLPTVSAKRFHHLVVCVRLRFITLKITVSAKIVVLPGSGIASEAWITRN